MRRRSGVDGRRRRNGIRVESIRRRRRGVVIARRLVSMILEGIGIVIEIGEEMMIEIDGKIGIVTKDGAETTDATIQIENRNDEIAIMNLIGSDGIVIMTRIMKGKDGEMVSEAPVEAEEKVGGLHQTVVEVQGRIDSHDSTAGGRLRSLYRNLRYPILPGNGRVIAVYFARS